MTTPGRLPDALVQDAHELAEALARVAGDEAAVLAVIARTARTRDPQAAAAFCVAALAYTYGRCVVLTHPLPPSDNTPKEKTP